MTPAVTTIAKGDGSGIVEPRRTVVRDAVEWRALWAAHAGPAVPAPPVDFATDMVAAVFAGERPTPGYEIEIGDTRPEGTALAIVVSEVPPTGGMMAAQVIVSPFHLVRLPRHEGEVRFIETASTPLRAEASPLPREPVPRPPTLSANAPSSTGLDPNLAAALAYLAGPFSGVLILLVERANGFVRFHAWQSIVGLGGLGLLSAATLVLSFLTLLLSPFVFTVMYRFSELVAIVWVVAWVVCLVKAFTGDRWEMPVAGRYAARLATRHLAP
jgi:uncharacterized membrane protein